MNKNVSDLVELWTVLVARYSGPLYGFLMKRLRNPSVAEELVQETFLRAFKNPPANEPADPSAWGAWLYGVCRNVCSEHLRTGIRIAIPKPLGTDPISKEGMASVPIEDEETRKLLQKAVDNLAPQQRRAIILYYYEQKSHVEMTSIMNIAKGTIGPTLSDALENLRVLLRPEDVL